MQSLPELPKAFAELGVEVRFLKAVRKMGFVDPSDIQREMIPAAIEGRDIMGQARTGTGKTAAFALPILQGLDPAGRLQAICLAPTRELAVQVATEIKSLAAFTDLHIVPVYGGQKISTQLHLLGRKTHFVVGTPGRVMDFQRRGVLKLDGLRFVVLDEVDRMLDIGFRDDIKTILRGVRGKHQTIFVSATIDDEINRLARQFMTDPIEINVSQDRLTVDEVDQFHISVEPHDKFRLLKLILKQEDSPITIVFCNTKASARKLGKRLHEAGVNAKEIHGDLVQHKRDRVMSCFRKHQIKVLVATDLAARGIDVSAISHIINYDMPSDPYAYVHRIGRTARMGARGVAIAFVTKEQGKELTEVEKLINREIPHQTIADFVPCAPREHSPEPSQPPRMSRYQAPIHSSGDETARKPPPKTLGSRFRPARGRRRF